MGKMMYNTARKRHLISGQTLKIYPQSILTVLFAAFFAMATILHIPHGGLLLGAVLISIALLSAWLNQGVVRLEINGFHIYMFLLAAYIALSMRWAIDPSLAWRRVMPLVETAAALVLCYTGCHDEGAVDRVLKAIMYRGYITLFYIVASYGASTLIRMLTGAERIDNEVLNANVIGYFLAYAMIINLYYIFQRGIRLLPDVLVLPSFALLVISGSRKGLVLLVGGVLAVFVFQNWDRSRRLRSFGKIVGVVALLGLIMLLVIQLPFMSGILKRMTDLFTLLAGQGDGSTSGFIRFEYIKLGMELFREHPLLGIGIDNARIYTMALYGNDHYLHNNYVELLACGGIVGFALYYWIYAYLFYQFWKYRRFRDSRFDICLILMVCSMVMEYGMVTYESRDTYCLMLVLWVECDHLRRRAALETNRIFAGVKEKNICQTNTFNI